MKRVGSVSWRIAVVAALVLIVGVALCLSGCPKKPEGDVTPEPIGEQPTAPIEPSGEPVKVGAIFSVTGPASPLGDPEKKTVELLVGQINEAGGVLGRPLEVIVKDDKSEPADAVIAMKDLIENEEVVAIIGPSRTPTTLAIKEECQEAEVPLISCAAGKEITDPVASYVFATPQTNALAAEKCFEYLTEEGIKSIAVLSVANSYGEDGLANIEAFADEKGIEIAAKETFGGEDTDMSAQLTSIKSANPGAIIIWGTNPGPAIATKNAKTLGIDVPIVQSHGVANMKFIELAGDAANGVQLPAGRLIVCDQIPDDDPQKEVLDSFAVDYQAEYDELPNTFAGHAYDSLHIVVKALEAAGEVDRAKLRDAIEQTTGFVGTGGTFNYSAEDHNGLTVDAFVWVEIVDGKWTLAE
jgi:branched-chain amino acid transport system substrate-binding protein